MRRDRKVKRSTYSCFCVQYVSCLLNVAVCVRQFMYVPHTHSHSCTSTQALGFHKHHNRQAAEKYVVITYSVRAAVSGFHNMLSLREDISVTLEWDIVLRL